MSIAIAHQMTQHMALHIFIMGPLAALLVLAFRLSKYQQLVQNMNGIWASSLMQIAVFLYWHCPAVVNLTIQSVTLQLLMYLSLFSAAVWFWNSIIARIATQPWQSVFALLVTGKIFCLLAALLVFAPRFLVPELAGDRPLAALMADQQKAGLLMLLACPAIYLGSCMVISINWFNNLFTRLPTSSGSGGT